jgi:membrane-associated phospholipid phosphatase
MNLKKSWYLFLIKPATLIALLILAFLLAVDRPLYAAVAAQRTPYLAAVLKIFKIFGRLVGTAALSLGLWLAGWWRDNALYRRCAARIVAGVVLSGAIVLLTKPIIGRQEFAALAVGHSARAHQKRVVMPSHLAANANLATEVETEVRDRWGRFPSGDSAQAFAIAAALAIEFPTASALFFVVAAITAIGRVYCGAHLPSDVFAGGWLGWQSGIWVSLLAARSRRKRPQTERASASLQPKVL